MKKIPCINAANDVMQPIRLHCKILNLKEFAIKISAIKCVEYSFKDSLFNWFYKSEMLKSDYKIERKTEKAAIGELWILGKIQVVPNNVLLISVNSIERAILALKFFSSKIDKSILEFETMDFYNTLKEMTEGNRNFHAPIELFFVNKPIVGFDNFAERAMDKISATKSRKEKQILAAELFSKMTADVTAEYENFPINFYVDSIEAIKSRLFLKQRLAYEHLNGNTSLTMYQLIHSLVDKPVG